MSAGKDIYVSALPSENNNFIYICRAILLLPFIIENLHRYASVASKNKKKNKKREREKKSTIIFYLRDFDVLARRYVNAAPPRFPLLFIPSLDDVEYVVQRALSII